MERLIQFQEGLAYLYACHGDCTYRLRISEALLQAVCFIVSFIPGAQYVCTF
jgi:hypothetical protein